MNEERDEAGATSEGQGEVSEEEYRKAMEEELRKASVQDIVVQSVVTILNLTSRRIALDEERDLAQARLGIDVAGAISEHLPEEIKGQVDQALSQLRLEFAKHAGPGSTSEPGGPQGGGEQPSEPSEQSQKRPAGGSGLWTPPGT